MVSTRATKCATLRMSAEVGERRFRERRRRSQATSLVRRALARASVTPNAISGAFGIVTLLVVAACGSSSSTASDCTASGKSGGGECTNFASGGRDAGISSTGGASGGAGGTPGSAGATTSGGTGAATGGVATRDAGEDASVAAGGNRGQGGVDAGSPGDGGNVDGGNGADVTCRALPPSKDGVCTVAPGKTRRTLITGTILTPERVLHGGQVLIDETASIACVGCDCAALGPMATTITCPSGVVSPGLINTHDHLQYSHDAPQAAVTERYDSRNQWRRGLDMHSVIAPQGNATTDQMRWGELRFVMGGATSTVAQASTAGLLRNLNGTQQEGLGHAPAVDDTFPLDDGNGVRSTNDCSVYGANAITQMAITADNAYLAHVGEGIDAYAANEFRCLGEMNPPHDALSPKASFVHGAALTAADFRDLAASHTGLVWSPRSNLSLYGDTLRVTEAVWSGALIALGTDWLPTGSMNLLRELACADSFNRERLGGFLSDRDLWLMVTANAAAVTRTTDALGVLAPGRVADIAIFDGTARPSYRAVIGATPSDVTLVLRSGKPLYGDAAVVNALSAGCDAVDVCGTPKAVCLTSEIGKTYPALAASVGAGAYPAFACGTPPNEPTCTPARPVSVGGSSVYDGTTKPEDSDGDGVPDGADDCPVFDPIRPMDSGKQPDSDGDGLGDACDPCPLVTGAVGGCSTPDPGARDGDGDGVPDLTDDCPSVADPAQVDTDGDGTGDACDPCPMTANPGRTACPSSIYDVKSGAAPVGALVALPPALATARNAQGYFVEVPADDPMYRGRDGSGVFVFDPTNDVVAGTRVTLSRATVAVFGGETELSAPNVAVETTAVELVAPLVVAAAEVVTGGPRAGLLEGVLVEVDAVTVTDAAPPAGAGDKAPTNEFAVDAGLRVDDYFHAVTPLPAVGTKFSKLVGVLRFANGNTKLEPRDATDLVP